MNSNGSCARPSAAALAAEAARALARETGAETHGVAVILGSGWGGAASAIGPVRAEIPAGRLPGFDPSPIPGHEGVIRSVAVPGTGQRALVISARAHYYERRDAQDAAHPVRLAAAAGAKAIILTNGCGAIVPPPPGGVVLIKDHINLTGATPLAGPQFVDMTDAYSPRLRAAVRALYPELTEGVYAQFAGPQYETPAEVRMAGILGADLVGMSTALEAIAARAAGLEVLGLAFATNPAAGTAPEPLAHEDVLRVGREAAPRLAAMLARIVPRVLAAP